MKYLHKKEKFQRTCVVIGLVLLNFAIALELLQGKDLR